MSTTKELKQQQKLLTELRPYMEIVKPPREVGLEVEIEGLNLIHGPILPYWSYHHEPSLRGDDNAEYVLTNPVRRGDVRKAMDVLSDALKAAKSRVAVSNRTSVHTHVNVQDLTMKEIMAFVVTYMVFEDALVGKCGASRCGNLFCLRSGDAEYVIRLLEKAISTDNYELLITDDIRYSSCNLAALFKYGSLEFRALECTVDPGRVSDWVSALLEIKDFSRTFEDPSDIPRRFSELSPLGFLKAVGPVLGGLIGGADGIEKSLVAGLRRAQGVAYATKWLPTPAPVKAKDKAKVEKEVPKEENPFVREAPDFVGNALHRPPEPHPLGGVWFDPNQRIEFERPMPPWLPRDGQEGRPQPGDYQGWNDYAQALNGWMRDNR